ncbi:MAG: NUDIX domain-containing protein [Eubacteriales bacterium]|jgi:8-oxo-dGTP diphosphatase
MSQDNFLFAASGVVVKDNKVLLVRHTYGGAKDRLLIPGGFCKSGELPEETAVREVLEETGVTAKVKGLLAVRFSRTNWYPVFVMEYISGIPVSDGVENSEAVFMDIDEALSRNDVTEMTTRCLLMYKKGRENSLLHYPEYGAEKGYSLYGTEM